MRANYFKAIPLLLTAIGWRGDRRSIFEALPHLTSSLDLDGLREVFINLGYESQTQTINLRKVTNHVGLFRSKNQTYILLGVDEDGVHMQDVETEKTSVFPKSTSLKGTLCYFYTAGKEIKTAKSWLHEIASRFKKQIHHLLLIGVFNALFALTIPLFIRAVFDWAIPGKSDQTLTYLIYGLALALLCHHFVHIIQNKNLAYIGARLNMIIGTAVVNKILRLPYHLIENASVPDQIARIKQFDSIRDFFTSPLAQLVMEGPFFIFFIIVLAFLGGPLAIIPIVLLACFAILGVIVFPMVRGGTKLSSITHNEKVSFLVEAFSKINTLKHLGGESAFSKRFEEKAYGHTKSSENNEIVMAYATNLAQILIKGAGIITVIWGAIRVMDGDMTVGSLVAVVLLIWRALSPIQSAFMFLSQFDQTLNTMKQINQLMSLPSEQYAPSHVPMRKLEGAIHIDNIAFRYPTNPNLALQGVTVDAKPGEVIGIMGENGSGKSTLLKLLLGFYQPIAGSISLDGVDTKQIPVNHLRKTLAFVPQSIQFFHGTVEQNLLLSAPDASREDVIQACKDAFVWDDIQQLPNGLETRLTDRTTSVMNSGFQQKLSLARAYLRKSSILIFDEPGSNLDIEGDEWFKKTVDSWRGKKTMVIVTHRPSVLKMTDKILALSHGKMKYFGPTDKVLALIEQEKGAA